MNVNENFNQPVAVNKLRKKVMANKKRSRQTIQERFAKKRKQEDDILENGSFQNSVDTPGQTSWEDHEQDYELKPRMLKDYKDDIIEGLPIKVDGKVKRTIRTVVRQRESDVSVDMELNERQSENNEDTDEFDLPNTEESIITLKEEISELVEGLIEDPEENIHSLSRLRKMAQSKNPNTGKFSLLALIPVFRSIIPGYKIRPLTELEKKAKVSKEISRLRKFEELLVLNYKHYITLLGNLARSSNNNDSISIELGNLATKSATELASSFSHFNFRTDVLTILIHRICKPNPSTDSTFFKVVKTLETLLSEDDEGSISLEIVQILSKIMKGRRYNINESVLNVLLSLDILSDYDSNNKTEQHKKPKLKKKDRIHLSKRERKARKELRQIEDEMHRAELVVSAEEKEKNQAEVLKCILSLYLNILKENIPNLIGSVLEGLSKFGHMANFDLLGDFLEVMKEIISNSELDKLSSSEIRKVLLCIVTAYSLISDYNHSKISMDLSAFVDALYSVIPYLSLDADIEFSHKSLRLLDPLDSDLVKPSVNVSTKSELLLKALDHIFLRSKSGTKQRAFAFTKRLYMAIEHTPEKTSIAIIKFLKKLMTKYPEICGLYSTDDRVGNGIFHMDINSIVRSNSEASMLWENNLLSIHYCPAVVKGSKELFNMSRDSSK